MYYLRMTGDEEYMGQILASVTRGLTDESIHNGHIAVVQSNGELILGLGDPDFKTYFRSAMKPLQAAVVLDSGVASRLKFSDVEIAVIAASHSGEPKHIKVIEGILKKAKIKPNFLHCGKALPLHKLTFQKLVKKGISGKSIYHNCSGKHSGLLAAAKDMGPDFKNYFSPEHSIQKKIFTLLSKYSDIPISNISFGVDGCGLPTAALPLKGMALTFARLADEFGKSSVGKIGKIMSENPWYIGGTKRFDTEIMEYFKGKIVAKGGAEGILCLALPEKKLGIAIKCEDGSHRALSAVTIALLEKLGVINKDKVSDLKKKFPHWYNVFNSREKVVGEIVPKI